MCGRYALDVTGPEIAAAFGGGLGVMSRPDLGTAASWRPHWNISPTMEAPIIRAAPDGGAVIDLVRWGLVPPWSHDAAPSSGLINARGETVASKPSFRDGFRRRRAIVPARGFYEWTSIGRRRIPHAIRSADDGLLAFAAIWSRCDRDSQAPFDTFAIITTAANRTLRPIHDRMPVVLDGADRERWLDHRAAADGGPSPEELQAMLRACPDERLRMHPVSTRVNRPVEDGPDLLAPVAIDADAERSRAAETPGLFDAEA